MMDMILLLGKYFSSVYTLQNEHLYNISNIPQLWSNVNNIKITGPDTFMEINSVYGNNEPD